MFARMMAGRHGGLPLHRKISVRFAKSGEEIISIDGISRKLSPEILVIADKNRPLAIAGIMGVKKAR